MTGPAELRRWRQRRSLTQHEVCLRLGIDQGRYNAWERGRARPGLDWAVRIEQLTDGVVPVEYWARA